jgi:ketosteroid isomerase-like protein
MSQENLEIIRRLYEDFLSDPQRLASPETLRFFDPHVEIRQSTSLAGTEGRFHGHEGVARVAREQFDVLRGLHLVPQRFVENGDHVVVTAIAHAYGKDSGVEVSATVGHFWTLRDGLIVAWHVYWDLGQAFRAAGLPGDF